MPTAAGELATSPNQDQLQLQVSRNSSSAGAASAKADFGAIKYGSMPPFHGTHVPTAEELHSISDFYFRSIAAKQMAVDIKKTFVSHGWGRTNLPLSLKRRLVRSALGLAIKLLQAIHVCSWMQSKQNYSIYH